jgi:uncharacterized protein
MQPFAYHDGQREVQHEANSIACADKLSTWVGPVADFATIADLIVLANHADDVWRIVALSGTPPLVAMTSEAGALTMRLPATLHSHLPDGGTCGGIVINPAMARRSRVSGVLRRTESGFDLPCAIAFTNCRKYMAPTVSNDGPVAVGPTRTHACALTDDWIARTIAHCETAFLVTATPANVADVSHRGGTPGFLRYYPAVAHLSWTEYLGDGMFVSTGNIRRRRDAVLVAIDFETGDAARLDLECDYENLLADRHERVDALIQAGEPFPVQGRMTARVRAAARMTGFCLPRAHVASRARITSTDSTAVQHPQ